uniref:Uncharacterized protein n=1 Tax=Rhizoctonia solani TaxID=456999 RepID=N0ACR8_9AGAM|nr:hypothetical protein RSOL_m00430 [Rhizoctonia solani]AGK45377.1 hypothetical protein RSOL_m00430 [Rhizoctonia solani]
MNSPPDSGGRFLFIMRLNRVVPEHRDRMAGALKIKPGDQTVPIENRDHTEPGYAGGASPRVCTRLNSVFPLFLFKEEENFVTGLVRFSCYFCFY